MIDVSPTAAISVGASVPLAALGRATFEPGTGMHNISAGPAASIDLGVLIAQHVLPHVRFERAWVSCVSRFSECNATNDVAALGLRVTSKGQFRVFGDVGFGLRRLATDPTPERLTELGFMELLGLAENRSDSDGSRDIVWSGIDTVRLAIGSAYRVRDELAIEVELLTAVGVFRKIATSSRLNANQSGFSADLNDDMRKPYVIFGLSLAARGFLP